MVVLSGSLRGRAIDVLRDPVRLGKSRQCEVVVPDDSVSRVHAEIRREDGRYRLLDRGSTNGTFLRGARVSDAWLEPGDVVGLGKVELRFVPREQRPELLPSEAERFGPAVGSNLAMRRVFGMLERVADKDVSVLLCGEPGTGKDLLARAIHDASPRRGQSFVIVDCSAAGKDALGPELFGGDQLGALEAAQGGTLFLDEVDGLPIELQPKLLRAIETQRLRTGGGERDLDVRVIAASQTSLEQRIADGEFRRDLYSRLAVVRCDVPPLRERREDIPRLIELFSRRLPPGMWRPPGAEAMARLVGYEWPGNVRELRNVVERSAYLSPDGVIDLVTAEAAPREGVRQAVTFDPTLTFREQKERVVERFEEAYLHWLLERARGNISRGAREADMDRKYLHKLLRRYGIDAKQYAR